MGKQRQGQEITIHLARAPFRTQGVTLWPVFYKNCSINKNNIKTFSFPKNVKGIWPGVPGARHCHLLAVS